MLESEKNYEDVPKNISAILNESMERYKTLLTYKTNPDSKEQSFKDLDLETTFSAPLWPITETDLAGKTPT